MARLGLTYRAYAHATHMSINAVDCRGKVLLYTPPHRNTSAGGMVMSKTKFGLGVVVAVAVMAAGEGRVSLAQDQAQEQISRVPQLRPDGLGPQLVCGTKNLDPETARLSEE